MSNTDTAPQPPKVGRRIGASNASLDARVRDARRRIGGLRRVEPLADMMGLEPNRLVAKEPPQPIMLRPTELWVDGSYQRDMTRSSLNLVMRIIRNFSWEKFKAPVITKDKEGRFVVIDGQHTAIAAATHPEIDKIPCMFVPMDTVEKQAQAFIAHNTEQVRIQTLELFHAKLTAKDETALGIEAALKKHNIALLRHIPGSSASFEVNQTMAVGRLAKTLTKYGSAKFNQILEVVAKCNFRPIRADHLAAVAIVLYEGEADEPDYSPDLLVEIITSLNDSDSLMRATQISQNIKVPKSRALAMYYKGQYDKVYHRS